MKFHQHRDSKKTRGFNPLALPIHTTIFIRSDFVISLTPRLYLQPGGFGLVRSPVRIFSFTHLKSVAMAAYFFTNIPIPFVMTINNGLLQLLAPGQTRARLLGMRSSGSVPTIRSAYGTCKRPVSGQHRLVFGSAPPQCGRPVRRRRMPPESVHFRILSSTGNPLVRREKHL